MSDIIFGLYVLVAIVSVKAIILFVRYSFAQRRVNKAYKVLTRWQRRHDWAVEDGSWLDADNIEWSVDVLEEVVKARQAAFDKAVNQRDFIRF